MAEKTIEELLASGSLAELNARIDANTKRAEQLIAESEKRPTKAMTAEELTEFDQLDADSTKLAARRDQLQKVEDGKKRFAKHRADLTEPNNRIGFQGGEPDNKPDKRRIFASNSEMKHIKLYDTRRENEELAIKFFHFVAGGVLKRERSLNFCKENGIDIITDGAVKVSGSMSEDVNEAGGVLVPPEFNAMIIRLVEQFGVFRRNAEIVPMTSDVKNRPKRVSGLTTYWVVGGQTITRSRPTYTNVQLIAKKLAALTAIDSELSEDSAVSVADQLAFEFALAFALMEDQSGFIGDGTSTYGGIVGVTNALKNLDSTIANIAGLVVGTGNAYSELVLADFEKVAGRLPQYADVANPAWYAHRTFYYEVMLRLALAAGGTEAREIIAGDRRGRPLFLGYPVEFTQVMPSVEANSQVCTVLGDLALAAMLGDRRRVTIFNDPYSLSADDQTQMRGTERLDINVHSVGNASATAADRVAGPVVGLITAAS